MIVIQVIVALLAAMAAGYALGYRAADIAISKKLATLRQELHFVKQVEIAKARVSTRESLPDEVKRRISERLSALMVGKGGNDA